MTVREHRLQHEQITVDHDARIPVSSATLVVLKFELKQVCPKPG